MILAILFIGLNVVLEAWPLWAILFSRLVHRPLSTAEIAGIATSFAAVVTFDLAVFAVATARGIRALEELRRDAATAGQDCALPVAGSHSSVRALRGDAQHLSTVVRPSCLLQPPSRSVVIPAAIARLQARRRCVRHDQALSVIGGP
jgi:hypothetical protein